MRKTLLLAILATFATTLFAQPLREEIRNNLRCSASHDMAYRGPRQLNTPSIFRTTDATAHDTSADGKTTMSTTT